MDNGSWVLLMLAAVVTVGYLGYLLGRRNSAKQAEIDRLEEELQVARERADSIKAGLDSHFEQSAVLFGTLAKDYRAFLDHFSESASNLGVSQNRTEELLEQVARPLLARSTTAAPESEPEPVTKPEPSGTGNGDGAAPTAATATDAEPPIAATAPQEHKAPGPDGNAGDPADATAGNASADEAPDSRTPDASPAADTKHNGSGQAPGSPAASPRD